MTKVLFLLILSLITLKVFAQKATKHLVPAYVAPQVLTKKGTKEEKITDIDGWAVQIVNDINEITPDLITLSPKEIAFTARSVHANLSKEIKIIDFKDENLFKAQFAAWVELMIINSNKEKAKKEFNASNLTELALEQGLLVIKTQPSGALVKIDGYEGFGTSDISIMAKGGVRQIILSKEGYVAIKEKIIIEPLKIFTLERELKKKNN